MEAIAIFHKFRIHFILWLLIGATILVGFIFFPYLSALILALTLAVLFQPLYIRLLGFFKQRYGRAAFFTVLLVIVIVLTPLVFFAGQIVQEATHVYTSTFNNGGGVDVLRRINLFIETKGRQVIPDFTFDARYILRTLLDWLVKNIGSIFSGVAQVLFQILLSLMALYYFLKDGGKLKKSFLALSPMSEKYNLQIIERLRRAINSTIKGSLLIAVIQGVLTGIGFAIFGVPNATLWGGATIVAALVPSIGTALVIVPGIAWLFLTGEHLMALGLSLWGVLFVGLVDNFLKPQFISKHGIPIHPFLILVSVLGGIGLFGPIGFLAGPLTLSLFFALLDIYREEFIHAKEHAQETE